MSDVCGLTMSMTCARAPGHGGMHDSLAFERAAAAIGERLRADFERIYREEAPTMTEHERALARLFVESIATLAAGAALQLADASRASATPGEDWGGRGEGVLP